MKLSVLIPIYNEIATLTAIIEKISSVDLEKELIIVDDCSTDGSRELLLKTYANRKDVRIICHQQNLGKGAAVREALQYAQGEYTIIQDADLEYDPKDYLLLLEAAQNYNTGVIYGSRFKSTWRATSLWHFIVNKLLTEATNLLFGSRLTDMETCYKIIRTDIFKSLQLESRHFEIEPEITAKLLKKGHTIIEIPISYKGRSYHEGKKISWVDGLITLWVLLKSKFSVNN
ncbi:MAG: glycosyltransferase family 2 protein [Candidatus Omnitrophica bacterium]|nr:glycosyltransferase family 2 protein [Candidatus Omnitrophota bacterium]